MLAELQKELRVHYAQSRKIIEASDLSARKAKTFFLKQKWKLAVPEYARLNAVNGFDARLFVEQGVVLGNLNRYEESLAHYIPPW